MIVADDVPPMTRVPCATASGAGNGSPAAPVLALAELGRQRRAAVLDDGFPQQ